MPFSKGGISPIDASVAVRDQQGPVPNNREHRFLSLIFVP
jgi:hypothetical protein